MRQILAILLLATGSASAARAATCPMGLTAPGNPVDSSVSTLHAHGQGASSAPEEGSPSADDSGADGGSDHDPSDGPTLPCSPSMTCGGAATVSTALDVASASVGSATAQPCAATRPRSVSFLSDPPPPRLPV